MMWLVTFQWLLTVGIVAGIIIEFPNPQKEFKLCGRRNASFICDPELILDITDGSLSDVSCWKWSLYFYWFVYRGTRKYFKALCSMRGDRLHQLSSNFRKSTKCLCSECEMGISFGVFIRSRLSQETMEKYPSGRSVAEMLRKRWHLGKCNDDIIIVLLTEMNISDYSLGPAVQKIFSDETAELIMKDCRAHFLSGWYYQGLESVATSFNDVLIKLQKEKKTFSKSLITGISLGIGVLLILLILAILLLRRQKKIRKKGCSDIYESISIEKNQEKFLTDIRNKQNFEILNTSQNSDEDEESEDETSMMSQQFLHTKRHLSAVVEESDDNETLKDSTAFIKETYSPPGQKRSLQVTEL